jgi:hypothetical protein
VIQNDPTHFHQQQISHQLNSLHLHRRMGRTLHPSIEYKNPRTLQKHVQRNQITLTLPQSQSLLPRRLVHARPRQLTPLQHPKINHRERINFFE